MTVGEGSPPPPQRPRLPYGEIITRSWSILWRNPFLWFLGALAGFAAAGAPSPNLVYNLDSIVAPGQEVPKDFQSDLEQAIDAVIAWGSTHVGLLVAIAAAVLLVLTIFWFIGIYFGSALIASTGELERGEASGLRKSIAAGRRVFWRYVGLSALFDITSIIVVGIAVVPLALAVAGVLGGLAGPESDLAGAIAKLAERMLSGSPPPAIVASIGIAVVIAVPSLLFLHLLRQLCARALILDVRGVGAALVGGAHVFRAAPGRTLLVWLISQGLSLAAVFVIATLIVVVMLPIVIGVLIALAVGSASGSLAPVIVLGALAAVAFIGMILVTTGAQGAYFAAYWTLAYRKLTAHLVS